MACPLPVFHYWLKFPETRRELNDEVFATLRYIVVCCFRTRGVTNLHKFEEKKKVCLTNKVGIPTSEYIVLTSLASNAS